MYTMIWCWLLSPLIHIEKWIPNKPQRKRNRITNCSVNSKIFDDYWTGNGSISTEIRLILNYSAALLRYGPRNQSNKNTRFVISNIKYTCTYSSLLFWRAFCIFAFFSFSFSLTNLFILSLTIISLWASVRVNAFDGLWESLINLQHPFLLILAPWH